MKKLLAILAICLLPGVAWGATYYGGAGSKALNADDLWFDAVDGNCSGTALHGVNWATASANGNKLIANGCTVTIPNTSTQTLPATGTITLSNKTDVAANVVDGGQFTFTTEADYTVTLQTNIEAGGTTGAPLAVTGTENPGSLSDVLIIGSSGTPVTITGGSAGNIYGLSDTHNAANARVTLYASVSSGSHTSGHGIYRAGAAGVFVLNGNSSGVTGTGLSHASGGTVTVNGNCSGGTGVAGHGCNGSGSTPINVIGNILNTVTSSGAVGRITWSPPTAKNYVRIYLDGSNAYYLGAGLASDSAGTQITGANTAAKISSDTYFIRKDSYDGSTLTQGTKAGGGAWAQ